MSEERQRPSATSAVGRSLAGRYEIVAELGAGGMGAVYRARQLSMGRLVALKLIHPAIAANEQIAARFHREMQAMSLLAHPNTVQVFDYGQAEDGQHFLAMELLDGRTLAAVLRQDGPLPLPRIVHIAAQVLRALGAAHAQGIVHRDLKPDNVMLLDFYGERDFVKVLDFGIASFLGTGEGEGPTRMTAAGALLGTPAYMAPEQALGQRVGPATDLYAIGVMLYQMATGSLPFAAAALPQMILAHAQERPRPPSELAPVDPRLEALVLELLEKDPARRPQPAAEVMARLQACLPPPAAEAPVVAVQTVAAGEGEQAATQGALVPGRPLSWESQVQPSPRRRWPWLAAGLLALLGGAGAVAQLRLAGDPAARARLSAVLVADGDRAPPAACQARRRTVLQALLPAAELVAQGRDAEAVTALSALEPALGGQAEYWALRTRALLAAQQTAATGEVERRAVAEAAAQAARRAAVLCPDWAVAYNLLGNAQQLARRLPEAEKAYQEALRRAPDYVAPRYNLGLLAMHNKDLRAAVLAFDEVLRRAPDHPRAHLTRGYARLLLRDVERAIADLGEATRRHPDQGEAWLRLGEAQMNAGDQDAARRAFCRARALGHKEAEALCP